MKTISKAQGLHLPNTWNCIQSALYQLERGNTTAAIAALKSAQKSLSYLKKPNKMPLAKGASAEADN